MTNDRAGGTTIGSREWRELARIVLEACAAGLVVSLVLALAVFIVTSPALAATAAQPSGMLYLKEDGGSRTATPLVFTDVHMNVTGMIARVSVAQRFVNPTSEWREGVYVFPLPETAAVDHLHMTIGERVIDGVIEERGDAKRAYDAAKSEGRKASLLDEERPNLFTTSVANIGPNDEIVVAIEYQQTLRYDDGVFRLRFPLAITPRYIPGDVVASLGDGVGWTEATRTVLDADRITPPVVPRSDGYVLPVRISIDLHAGFPLAHLASVYHPMTIEAAPDHRYRLTLRDDIVPAARDFELTFTPDVGAAPATAMFTETKDGKTYALLMALPPSAPTKGTPAREPREVTYIIDTSGSMEGVSIVQAREAVMMALDGLMPGDRFNVIEFNSITHSLFAAPVPLDSMTLTRAKQFVAGLRARGGTEMLPALEIALAGEREAAILRQVVFLTDGAVGNEDQILKMVSQRIGDRRLFSVGIGPAPNMFFMTKLAQFGRGTYTAIGDVREVQAKMSALFRKLESPALTDIAVTWPAGAEAWPPVIPDLYAGEPVVVTARFDSSRATNQVVLSGRRAGAAWGALLPSSANDSEPGVGVLWARAKIEALMDAQRQGAPEADIRPAVIDVALAHHLVSKFTSLVAVDVTPSRPAGITASEAAVAGNIPEGLTGFDQLPRTATPAPLLLLGGALALAMAGVLALRLSAATAMVAIALASTLIAANDASAEPRQPAHSDNFLLLPGHYDGDAGSMDASLANVPDRGWFVLVKDAAGSYLNRIPDAPGRRPQFLHELETATLDNSATLQGALGQLFYVNLPKAALRSGALTEVPLRRRALTPIGGRRYSLALGTTPFSLTVDNGYQGRAGAHYVIEHRAGRFEYLLDGFGWDSEIQYAGDIDRDGLPDFIVYVNGNNAGTWYVLLSSEAKPGMNAPSAALTAVGC